MDWLAMGQYGFFVWTSYGLTLLVVAVCAWQGRRRHEQVLGEIRRRAALMDTEQ